MKRLFTPLITLLCACAAAQDGTLDGSFGTGGKFSLSLDLPVEQTVRQKIIVLASGQILQTATLTNVANLDFGLALQKSDGTGLETTFANQGLAVTDFGGDDVATSMALQADGKILVAGYSTTTSTSFALARYLAGGTLDASFGTGGLVTTPFSGEAYAYAVALQPDGKILLAGFVSAASGFDFALARYEADGSPDAGFGTGGRQVFNFGVTDALYALALQADGSIVAAGNVDQDLAVLRLQPNGSADASFGTGGLRRITLDDGAQANAVVIQPDGKIVASGYVMHAAGTDAVIIRLETDGDPDAGFNGTGSVRLDINEVENAYALLLQADGKILAGGGTGTLVNNDFFVARYTAGGAIDPTFNTTGLNVFSFSGDDNAFSLHFQGSRIIAGGIASDALALARLNNATIVVPLQLLSFTAKSGAKVVQLQWTTAMEEGTSRFIVERSPNGSDYSVLGTVDAAGNSVAERSYGFTDAKPLPLNYYRLKMVDADGSYRHSPVVAVRRQAAVQLEAYPNPVRHTVYIQLKASRGPVALELFDITGRRIRTVQLFSAGEALSTSLPMEGLLQGVYLLRVNDTTIRLVKE